MAHGSRDGGAEESRYWGLESQIIRLRLSSTPSRRYEITKTDKNLTDLAAITRINVFPIVNFGVARVAAKSIDVGASRTISLA